MSSSGWIIREFPETVVIKFGFFASRPFVSWEVKEDAWETGKFGPHPGIPGTPLAPGGPGLTLLAWLYAGNAGFNGPIWFPVDTFQNEIYVLSIIQCNEINKSF